MASKIGLIIGSTKNPRIGIFLAHHVQNKLKPFSGPPVEIIDLAEQKLPLFDESRSPFSKPKDDPTPHYDHDHTKKWSTLIKQYSGFIFLTPEYNGSIPASLKNALDFLGHEWAAKPAGIVSYGGAGGNKAASHLRDILKVLRFNTVPTIALFKTSRETLTSQLEDGVFPEKDLEFWEGSEAHEKVQKLYSEITQALETKTE